VGLEAEQMILPNCRDPRVPRFIASGSLESRYIVMEFVLGQSLRDYLPRLALPACGSRDFFRRTPMRGLPA
jgi:serine/threonine protein kinase